MEKPLLVFQAPVASRSGYGDHSRDILRALHESDKYNIKIIPTRWGNTSRGEIDPSTEFGKWILQNLITAIDTKPDIFVQVSVSNEFKPLGYYNVGITAGVETTVVPPDMIVEANRMDLLIVPSQFTRDIYQKTVYVHQDGSGNKQELRLTIPVEVIFEGVGTIFEKRPHKETRLTPLLDNLPTDFNFLFVGHWLPGDIGEDRKDVGMLIKTFLATFKDLSNRPLPGLILKTTHGNTSVIDRERILDKIEVLKSQLKGKAFPPVHLVYGDLNEEEISELYHHPKVSAMVSFTKGEGYGRPLAEFCMTGKPIIVSKWSGHVDFLPEQHCIYLEGTMKPVHKSAANKFLLEQSSWFQVDYSGAATKLLNTYLEYPDKLKQSKGLSTNIRKNFSLEKMKTLIVDIFDKRIPKKPKLVQFKLPDFSQKP